LWAIILVLMGWGAIRDSRRVQTPQVIEPARQVDIVHGALLSAANPFAGVFWLSIGASVLPAHPYVLSVAVVAIMMGAIVLATLIWSVLLAGAASYGRRLVRGAAFRWLNAGAGFAMALFGLNLFWQTLATF
jgi:threonine/homoserine/homoserine lactone efflux protein